MLNTGSITGEFAFIPYVASGQPRWRRQRELIQSAARRHAALVSHARKEPKPRQAGNKDTRSKSQPAGAGPSHGRSQELHLQPCLTDERTRAAETPSDTIDHSCVHRQGQESELQQWQYEDPQHISSGPVISSRNRPPDCHFGSVGFSCRPLSDFDNTALQYFLKQVANQQPAVNLGKTLTGVTHSVLSMSQQVAVRAIHQLPLLESIIAFTAFNMHTQHPHAHLLASNGHKAAQRALRSVRTSLANREASLDIAYAVLYLTAISVTEEKSEDAIIHLKFLREVVRSRQPSSAYEYNLWQQIRAADTRLALHIGERPLTRGLWQAAEVPPEPFFDRPEAESSSQSVIDSSPAQTWCPPSSNSVQDGFHAAIEYGAISPTLRYVIDRYMESIAFLSHLSTEEVVTRSEKIEARWKCYECLDLLCMKWSSVRECEKAANKQATRLHDTSGLRTSPGFVTTEKRWLDKMVITALELHLMMCLSTARTLGVLSRRLTLLYEAGTPFSDVDVVFDERGKTAATLCLWTLIIGMLATFKRSPDFEWMLTEAQRLVLSLSCSEDEVIRKLNEFSPTACPPEDDFVDMIHKVFVDTFITWKGD